MADELEVRVAGSAFTGWRDVQIERALDLVSGRFQMTAPHDVATRWAVRPGDEVEVLLGGELVISGHVDSLRARVDELETQVTVAGRDRTADLVDSSAPTEPGEWRNVRLEELAEAIAAPLGVEVLVQRGAGFPEMDPEPLTGDPFEVFAIVPGETAHAAIERAARQRAVLLHSDAEGRLVITRAGGGGHVGVVAEGDLMKSAELVWRLNDRFKTYVVVGQAQGSDAGWGDVVAGVRGEALDNEIDRERTLVIVADGQATLQSAQDLASWEAAHRRARSLQLELEVPTWSYPTSTSPWQVNTTLTARVPSLGVDRQMLVRAVSLSRDDRGTTIGRLALVAQDAYDPSPEIPEGADAFDELLEASGERRDF